MSSASAVSAAAGAALVSSSSQSALDNLGGVLTGLNTTNIVNELIQADSAPVTDLQNDNTTIQSEITAWQTMNTNAQALEAAAAALTDPVAFQATQVTSSDSSIISGTTTGTVPTGTYDLTVNHLAQAEQLTSQGFPDTGSTTIGTGTITIGAGSGNAVASNYLANTVDSVNLAKNSALSGGSQTLVINSLGSAASQQLSGTFLGADAATASQDSIGPGGNITINGTNFSFTSSDTLGSVVDAINAKKSTTGVTATITGSADDWQVTLQNQTQGSNNTINYTESASILNGGSANNFDVAGTNASGEIGGVQFNAGNGNVLEDSAGDTIVLDPNATTGTATGAFSVVGSASIQINSTNNTLAGLAAAINSSGAGVTASIIDTGASSNPYQLLLTSTTTGTAGQIMIDTSQLSGGTAPAFSTLQAAQNAQLTLGSGVNAVNITNSSNTITNLIQGVTLNLSEAAPSTPVTVTIGNDTSTIESNINNFVTQYNNMVSFFNTQNTWDSTSNTGGVLLGDSTLLSTQSSLANMITQSIGSGGVGQLNLLSQVGITTNQDGSLSVNSSMLENALSTNLSGVAKLFAVTGTATSPQVQFIQSTSATQPSGTAGYEVQVTALGTEGRVTAGVAQSSPLAQAETLTINGVNISLSAGMTQSQVINAINQETNATGVTASGTQADGTGVGNYLSLEDINAGSKQTISAVSTVSNGGSQPVSGTSGIGDLQVTDSSPAGEAGTGTGVAGTDIQGTINGEPATGNGNFLTGNSGNANTAGLEIQVTGDTIGSYGTVSFSTGIACMMSNYTAQLTDSVNGAIAQEENGLQTQVTDNNTQITNLQAMLTQEQTQLTTEFADMETSVSGLQSQGTYLTQQMDALDNQNNSSSG